MDELLKEERDLRVSVEFTQRKFDDSKLIPVKNIRNDDETSCKRFFSRSVTKWNLPTARQDNGNTDGIQEFVSEKWFDTEDKVRKQLSEKLRTDPRKTELEMDAKPRSIYVKFSS
eukprot:superscaffoldBa00002946_g15721